MQNLTILYLFGGFFELFKWLLECNKSTLPYNIYNVNILSHFIVKLIAKDNRSYKTSEKRHTVINI